MDYDIRFSKKEQWIIFAILNGLALLAVLLFPLYMKIADSTELSKCGLVAALHLYCPACGGTRAFAALRRLDILESLRYNPLVTLCGALFVVYDLVSLKYIIQNKERGPLAKPWMIYTVLILWAVYFIVRNALLFFGIDLIGDVRADLLGM